MAVQKTSTENQTHAGPPPAPVRPELLAPAGDWECAKAAVENGADAIYFGLTRFNARMRAHNFAEADLPALMEFLHGRGVKGYVTFNTLVFTDELVEAEQHLRSIISAGVDAAIVQDVGICRLIRRLSPDFPIHASTQMTVTSAAGIEFAKELGCSLVVLARECSIQEIEKIRAAESHRGSSADGPKPPRTPAPLDSQRSTSLSQLPLEVFVHGALCVAYSGQCLTSEALGGRSANRGECAQACRMPYELISDGRLVPLGDRRYLLSPQDLASLEVLPDLVRAGVASLKIEGRLKTPEYVANITRVYRHALDRVFAEFAKAGSPQEIEALTGTLADQARYDLEMAFSRGLDTGWFRGINNQTLVHARFGKKRGVYLGQVTRIETAAVALNLEAPLKPGDGVVFDAGHPEEKEEGGRVYSVDRAGRDFRVGFGRGDLDLNRVHVGDRVWKTSDPDLDQRLRQTFSGPRLRFQRPVLVEVHGAAGAPLSVLFRDELGHVVEVTSRMHLSAAETQPLNTEQLQRHLGRLGGTPFKMAQLENHLAGPVILPFSELNRLRREAVSRLQELRAHPKRWMLNATGSGPADSPSHSTLAAQEGHPPRSTDGKRAPAVDLVVLVRNLTQLDAVLSCAIRTVYCEFEDPKKYRDAVGRFREWQAQENFNRTDQSEIERPQSEIFVVPPRIFKMGEEWILKQVRSCDADGYLIRNYDHLLFFNDCRRIGDFSLNVANPLTAEYFMRRFGLERVTASYDLNFRQLEALLEAAPPDWFELTVHQHIPMFHMEHCVFCAFLSSGTDYTNCGRPCDKHEVKLRDRVGAEHPLKADIGCRNTVFHARAQTGAEHVTRLAKLGIRHFRLEFLNESSEQIVRTIGKYRQLLGGEITGSELWRELKLLNQLGVTRGQMAVESERS